MPGEITVWYWCAAGGRAASVRLSPASVRVLRAAAEGLVAAKSPVLDGQRVIHSVRALTDRGLVDVDGDRTVPTRDGRAVLRELDREEAQ